MQRSVGSGAGFGTALTDNEKEPRRESCEKKRRIRYTEKSELSETGKTGVEKEKMNMLRRERMETNR